MANTPLKSAYTNLDILRLIKLSTGNLPTPDADNEGAIAYDSTTQTLKVSNGGAWNSAGSNLTLGAIGSTPNANGATLSGSVLNLEPASTSFGGIITTGAQGFLGLKTFNSGLAATTGNFSGAITAADAHFVTTDDTAPSTITAWDGRHVVVGATGATGRGLGISYSTGTPGSANLAFAQPNTAWLSARFAALDHYFYTGGNNLALTLAGQGATVAGQFISNHGGNTFRTNLGAAGITPSFSVKSVSGKFGALISGTGGTAFIVDSTGTFGIVADSLANYNADNLGSVGTLLTTWTPGVDVQFVLPINPASNNTQSVGTSSLRWGNVYSVLGNFSSALTAAQFHSTAANGDSVGVSTVTNAHISLNGDNATHAGFYSDNASRVYFYAGGSGGLVYDTTSTYGPGLVSLAAGNHDLGSATNRWRGLYVTGTTGLNVGGATITHNGTQFAFSTRSTTGEYWASSAAGAAFYTSNAAGTFQSIGPVNTLSEMADGASAIALKVNTLTSWVNATAKLQSWQTNNVEKAYITAAGNITATNFSGTSSGTNTGDITLAAIGSTANANGASLSGQVLTLQPASASFGGVVTTGSQSFAGIKTFEGPNDGQLTVSSTDTSGNVSALIIKNASPGSFGTSNIAFTRSGNFLGGLVGFESASFGLVNGITLSAATNKVIGFRIGNTAIGQFDSSGNFTTRQHAPQANNTYSSGLTGTRWSNIYSVLGDFTGLVNIYAGINKRVLKLFDDGTSAWATEVVINEFRTILEQNTPSVRFHWGTRTKAAAEASAISYIFTVDTINARVGVNTATPSVPLDVVGAGAFSSSVTATKFIATNTGASNAIELTTNGVIHFNGTGQAGCYLQSTGATSIGFGVNGSAHTVFDGNGLNTNAIRSRTATSLTATSTMVDGPTAVALIVDTSTTWADTAAKFLSIRTGGSEKFSVGYNGYITSQNGGSFGGQVEALNLVTTSGAVQSYTGVFRVGTSVSASLIGGAVDGASAVGVVLDNDNALANATAKLVSIRANAVEKAYVLAAAGTFVSGAAANEEAFRMASGAYVDFSGGAGTVFMWSPSAGILSMGFGAGSGIRFDYTSTYLSPLNNISKDLGLTGSRWRDFFVGRDVYSTTGSMISDVADGASAIGWKLDTTNGLTTNGARVLSVQTAGGEVMNVNSKGLLNLWCEDDSTAAAGIYVTSYLLSSATTGGDTQDMYDAANTFFSTYAGVADEDIFLGNVNSEVLSDFSDGSLDHFYHFRALNYGAGLTTWSSVFDVDGGGYTTTNGVLARGGNVTSTALTTPTNDTFTQGTGTLATATYYYRVAAFAADGSETLASTATSLAITGPAGVLVKWNRITGAAGYYIYGRSVMTHDLIGTVYGEHVTEFLDDGSVTPSGSPPGANTTGRIFADSNIYTTNGEIFSTNGQVRGNSLATTQALSNTNTSATTGIVLTALTTNTSNEIGVEINAAGSGMGLNSSGSKLLRIMAGSSNERLYLNTHGNLFFKAGNATADIKAGGVVDTSTSTVGNVGSGEDDLYVYSIPGNTLNANGRGIRFIAGGTFTSNTNSKTLRIRYGGTLVMTHPIAISTAGSWHVELTILRASAGNQRITGTLSFHDTSTPQTFTLLPGVTATTHDETGSLDVKVTAEGVSNDDIQKTIGLVEYL